MNKSLQLKKINAKWVRNCDCSLRETATQAVIGDGNANAKILFIGEAPGKKEDLQGIPFIGSAGKFLNELLASIHLRREDIYITNAVKYRPPENRDPLPDEIAACRDWLIEEIRVIDPQIIVPLGRHAMNHFLPDEKISEVHGRIFQIPIDGLGMKKILPLYHPAAALYNGSLRATLIRDFKKISKHFTGKKKFPRRDGKGRGTARVSSCWRCPSDLSSRACAADPSADLGDDAARTAIP